MSPVCTCSRVFFVFLLTSFILIDNVMRSSLSLLSLCEMIHMRLATSLGSSIHLNGFIERVTELGRMFPGQCLQ